MENSTVENIRKTSDFSHLSERERDSALVELLLNPVIPKDEILNEMGLFLKRSSLMQLFMMNDLYQQILNTAGCIMECGTRWGRNLATWTNLRGIYEPYNYTRKIIGFDTFEGFPSVSPEDSSLAQLGDYAVTPGHEQILERILEIHSQNAPISHIKKHEIIKGDATVKMGQYFEAHPETIVALAYFDFDIYEPTKKCLELVLKHVTKGSIIYFDQLNHQDYPGETIAFKEVIGLNQYKIRRSKYATYPSYIIIE